MFFFISALFLYTYNIPILFLLRVNIPLLKFCIPSCEIFNFSNTGFKCIHQAYLKIFCLMIKHLAHNQVMLVAWILVNDSFLPSLEWVLAGCYFELFLKQSKVHVCRVVMSFLFFILLSTSSVKTLDCIYFITEFEHVIAFFFFGGKQHTFLQHNLGNTHTVAGYIYY